MIGVTTGFITVGVFGSLPIIALRAVDYYLNIEPFSQLSEKLKRGISFFFLNSNKRNKQNNFKEMNVTIKNLLDYYNHDIHILLGVSWLMLELSGISVDIIKHENEKSLKECFSESCSLLTFSHSSNLGNYVYIHKYINVCLLIRP